MRWLVVFVTLFCLPFDTAARGARVKKEGYGERARFYCPSNTVLSEVYHDVTRRMELMCLPQMVCNEPGVCESHSRKSACTNKGEFLEGLAEIYGKLGGSVRHKCCQYKLPKNEEVDEVCKTVTINDQKYRRSKGSTPQSDNNKRIKRAVQLSDLLRVKRETREPETVRKVDIYIGERAKDARPGSQMAIKEIKKRKKSYMVKMCTLVCRRTTTTRRPTTKDPEKHQDPKNENDKPKPDQPGPVPPVGASCFGASDTVTTPTGQLRMDQLQENDKVLVLNSKFNLYSFLPVDWFIHRDPNQWANFITIETVSGKNLSLTPNHLVPILPCNTDLHSTPGTTRRLEQQFTVQAKFAKVGQCVITSAQARSVLEEIAVVKMTKQKGIFAPVTQEGSIVVNGLHASCYAATDNVLMPKIIFGLLNTARKWMSDAHAMFFSSTAKEGLVNLPFAVKCLMRASTVL